MGEEAAALMGEVDKEEVAEAGGVVALEDELLELLTDVVAGVGEEGVARRLSVSEERW